MADDRRVVIILCQFNSIERLSKRSNLVDLHEDGVGRAGVDAPLQELHVRYEHVISHELDLAAELVSQLLPIGPIALGTAVLDAYDRVFAAQLDVELNQLVTGDGLASALFERVGAVAVVE